MDFHGPAFVLAIIAMSMAAWVITTAIKAKHGYPLVDDWGKRVDRAEPGGDRKVALLTSENERLTGQVSRLEERIAVLERIATDPSERTARAIDALRDR
jgi:hypothetical protein